MLITIFGNIQKVLTFWDIKLFLDKTKANRVFYLESKWHIWVILPVCEKNYKSKSW